MSEEKAKARYNKQVTKTNSFSPKKPLRVAMLISADPQAAGGVQNHVLYLTTELEKFGTKVVIFGPQVSEQPLYENYETWCQRLAVPAPNGNWGEITFGNLQTDQTIKLLNSGEFDICHIHSPYLPFANWSVLTQVKIPIVATFHIAWQPDSSLGWFEPLFQPLAGIMSQQVKAVIFVSHQAQKNWQASCSPTMLQEVIVNGVSPEFTPDPEVVFEPEKPVKLLFLARLVVNKGLGLLIEALALLPKDLAWELTVVGTGKSLADFKNQVKKLSLGRQVKFVGEVFGMKTIRYFQTHQVFCAPYFDEGGTSLSIIEAMACGLPVVGFENPAFGDVMKNYPNPELFVPIRDVKALATALTKIITQPKLRKSLGEWAAKRAKKFDWTKQAEKTATLYQKILAGKTGLLTK